VTFSSYLNNVHAVALRDGQHLFDLRVDGESLPLVFFGTFSRVQAVFRLNDIGYGCR
jgi:hypothetical protein